MRQTHACKYRVDIDDVAARGSAESINTQVLFRVSVVELGIVTYPMEDT